MTDQRQGELGGGAPAGAGGRVVFVGGVHEAEPALRVLLESGAEVAGVVTAPFERADRMSGFVDLQPQAEARGVPVLRAGNVNAPGCLQQIRRWAPDLLVVVGWSQLIGPDLLALPPRGCVGFHASMLPLGRGRAPVNWAIIRGETRTGNTMMFLAPGADEGDIIAQRSIVIRPEDTCGTVYAAVAAAGALMLREHLPRLLAGTAPHRRQDPRAGNYLPKRTPAMGVTDFRRPAGAVHDWIRAQTQPYPGAFTTFDGRRVMLWHSAPPGRDEPAGYPGEVMWLEPGGVRVGTAGGSLLVTDVGDPGEDPRPAPEWFYRNGIRPGSRFDPVAAEMARWVLGVGPEPVIDLAALEAAPARAAVSTGAPR